MGQLFLMGYQYIKFEERSMNSSEYVGGIKNTDGQTDKMKAMAPSTFFKIGGITMKTVD